MNRLRLSIALIAVAASAPGCENVVPATDLPYVNHLVIRGFLDARQPIDSISVTHTLPLSVQYDPNQAAVPNANVSIALDGRTIPLHYIGYGYYTNAARDTVESGKTYSIDVTWNSGEDGILHAWASTLVPQPPNIQSASLDSTQWDTAVYQYNQFYSDTQIYLYGTVDFAIHTVTGEVYAVGYDSLVSLDSDSLQILEVSSLSSDPYYFHSASEAGADGILRLLDQTSLYSRDSDFGVFATIESFNGAYYDFLKTYYLNNEGGDIFGTGAANPKWNVMGDGIGIFIGEAESRTSFTFHR